MARSRGGWSNLDNWIRAADVARLLKAAEDIWGLDAVMIMGSCRDKKYTEVRFAVYLIAHDTLSITLRDVASILNKDPSTVASGIRAVRNRILFDREYAELVCRLGWRAVRIKLAAEREAYHGWQGQRDKRTHYGAEVARVSG